VVLLMFWSTDCAVCRDKMKELRENVAGWAGQPFELVMVSLDSRMADLDAYNAIINKAVPTKQRFVQLWSKQPGYKDSLGIVSTITQPITLPLAFVIDKAGKPVKRYQGRIPPQAWDDIADLL
jgi:thiol-disulfide isomerase/thioredoxin